MYQVELLTWPLYEQNYKMKQGGDFLPTVISNEQSELWSFADSVDSLESFKVKQTFGMSKVDGNGQSFMELKREEEENLSLISSFDYKNGKVAVFASEWISNGTILQLVLISCRFVVS